MQSSPPPKTVAQGKAAPPKLGSSFVVTGAVTKSLGLNLYWQWSGPKESYGSKSTEAGPSVNFGMFDFQMGLVQKIVPRTNGLLRRHGQFRRLTLDLSRQKRVRFQPIPKSWANCWLFRPIGSGEKRPLTFQSSLVFGAGFFRHQQTDARKALMMGLLQGQVQSPPCKWRMIYCQPEMKYQPLRHGCYVCIYIY